MEPAEAERAEVKRDSDLVRSAVDGETKEEEEDIDDVEEVSDEEDESSEYSDVAPATPQPESQNEIVVSSATDALASKPKADTLDSSSTPTPCTLR